MTTHRDRLLAAASAALAGRIPDILVRRDGDLVLLNAGRELMWTGYSPEAEFLKGLIVEAHGNSAVRLVAGCLAKFYNWTENADNDRAFSAALALPGAKIVATMKADGCLPYNGSVRMADGARKHIKDIRAGEWVLGMNAVGQVVPAQVTGLLRRPDGREWFKIRATKTLKSGNGKGNPYIGIICTPEHRFWDPRSGTFRTASTLRPGDQITTLRKMPVLPTDTASILLGKLLGDGYLGISKNTAAVTFGHREADADYIDWTMEALDSWGHSYRHKVISGYGSTIVLAHSKYSPAIKARFASMMDGERKRVPAWVADALNPVVLAFWYMDDGSLFTQKRHRVTFSTEGFGEADLDVLERGLVRLGFSPKRSRSKGKYWVLRLQAADSDRLFDMIAPYVPRVMRRKIPVELHHLLGTQIPPSSPAYFEYTTETDVVQEVGIPSFSRSGFYRARYDIETSTGNYFAHDILVHNSNLRPYVHPRTGQVIFATRGTLWSNPEETGGVDYSNLARSIATRRYPALLDAVMVGRYTVVCELIHPTARILTNYGATEDLIVITVIDLAEGRELHRDEVVAFCAQYRLAVIDAVPFEGGRSLTETLTALKRRFAGTDLEGAVVAVEHPSLPAPFRLKVKGETYLRMLALMRRCTLRGTVEKLYTYRINTWPELLGVLRSETPDLPEEVVGAYRIHFDHWAAWEQENYNEAARVLVAYNGLPANILNADQKTFAMAIANNPLRAFFFTIRKAVSGGELESILPGLRRGREPLLRGGPDVEAAVSI